MKPEIRKEIEIEELVRMFPASVKFLAERGIRCIACGEPVWGTLEDAANEKKINPEELDDIVLDLRKYLYESSDPAG